MKALLVNGSPHKKGSTNKALEIVAAELEEAGIQADIFWIGNKPIAGCMGCGACSKNGRCVTSDVVDDFLAIADDYDGYVFGSPVYFSGVAGGMKSFLDRAFMSNQGRVTFRMKAAATLTVARRAGTTATLEDLNKFVEYWQMVQAHSKYWPMVHGANADDVVKDEEGVQVLQLLGRNLAYVMKCLEAGRAAGLELPGIPQPAARTNFIR